jgi:hypothetical protein
LLYPGFIHAVGQASQTKKTRSAVSLSGPESLKIRAFLQTNEIRM